MPSQTAHRVALPCLRLSEHVGIVVSSGSIVSVGRSSFIFTVEFRGSVLFSNVDSLRRSRSSAQSDVGKRRASQGMKELIRRLVALALMTATREARPHLDLPDPESGGRNVSSNCYLRSFTTCAIYRADLPRVRKDASAFAGSTASSATIGGLCSGRGS